MVYSPFVYVHFDDDIHTVGVDGAFFYVHSGILLNLNRS